MTREGIVAQLHRQIDSHQSFLDTHSLRPGEWHEGCIRGLIDAVSIIEQHDLDLEERRLVNSIAKSAVRDHLCAVMLLDSRGFKIVRAQ